jgi:hypothetical protein
LLDFGVLSIEDRLRITSDAEPITRCHRLILYKDHDGDNYNSMRGRRAAGLAAGSTAVSSLVFIKFSVTCL